MKAGFVIGCAAVTAGLLACNREVAPPKRATVDADAGQSQASLTPTRLRWNGSEVPNGLLELEPRLQWQALGSGRGHAQTAYQVLVALGGDLRSPRPGVADVWDSGKVLSSESVNILYAGPGLQGRQRGVWTVRIWDEQDRPSGYADPAPWELAPWDEEIGGDFIGRQPPGAGESSREPDRSVTYVRKSFSLPSGFSGARFYASAFGVYEASINGQRVGEDVLAPGFTQYEKRALVQAHDVTSLLHEGENVIAAIVAGGWCTARLGGTLGSCGLAPPRVRVTLEVTQADGEPLTIKSDHSWKYSSGPIASAELYAGETYDARREMPGWDALGFDDSGWQPVGEYDADQELMVYPDPGPPLRVAADISARETRSTKSGTVFDLGRTIAGRARIALTALAGTQVSLRYARELGPDGGLDAKTHTGTDRYIAKGSVNESWESRFSLHEFRYVEVSGLPARSALSSLVGRAVRSEMPATGTLETSSPSINELFASTVQALERAFVSVPSSGVPEQRPGALLSAQAVALTACLNRDVQGFYRKWIEDIRDVQHQSGAYAAIAPGPSAPAASPSAAAGGVLVPWATYRCYADRFALDPHTSSMGRWLESVKAANPDLVFRNGLGSEAADPLESGKATDRALSATAELSYAASSLAQILRHGGGKVAAEAARYEALSEGARKAFNDAFVMPDGRLRSDTQTAYATAIERAVLRGSALERAGKHLAAAVERTGRRPTTGLAATALLLPALSKVGRDDLAYALLERLAEPASRYSPTRELAFAGVGEWMYDAIGGIALDPRAPAGRHLLVRPRPGAGLTHARASFDSAYGRIETSWTLNGNDFRLKVVVPPGSTATVTLPFPGSISESGRPVSHRVVEIQSGTYEFLVQRS